MKNEYKTSPAVRKAVKKYEMKISQDQAQKEKRTHQKLFSSTKSFLRNRATLSEIEAIEQVIQQRKQFLKDEQGS